MGTSARNGQRSVRTLLEAKIRDLNMTLDEFAEYAETFAHEHGETGTLSARHLQRLIAPVQPGGKPIDPRPATRRLLEHVFATPLAELLGPPRPTTAQDSAQWAEFENGAARLADMIATASRVDDETVRLLADQIDNTRRLDRRLGAVSLLPALRLHAEHIETLFAHCTDGPTYRALAAVLTDAHTLAGWQSLDRGEISAAWSHYRQACDAARAAESLGLHAHALAEQAVVLADVGRTADGATMSERARQIGADGPPLLRSWLAAAHGEALAADGQEGTSLHVFDEAARQLPAERDRGGAEPYLALDATHLGRWRGHALARLAHPDAVPVLLRALTAHDTEFTRAEAGLRYDLARAYDAAGEAEMASRHCGSAREIARAVGSVRQLRRQERQ